MSNEKIKQLLTQLRDEMSNTVMDDSTRSAIQDFEHDVSYLLDTPQDITSDRLSMLESAQHLESIFAAKHANTEYFIREIINTLAKIGV